MTTNPETLGLEQSWSNPFAAGTFLHDLYAHRVRQDRDLIILIDDFDAGRGTGKTVGALQLANGMDRTREGITSSKATLRPEEIRDAYATQAKGSGLVLDEGELGASNRQAMSKVNQALREIMSMGRVEEKYVVVTTPAKEFIDRDIQKLSDVWISMTKKGEGLVHKFEREAYSGQLLTPKKQRIVFEDISTDHELRTVYRELTREKRKRIRGDDGSGFIEKSEHEEKVKKARKEARREERHENIKGFYSHPETDASQRVVGEAVGVSQKTVSNVTTNGGDDHA